MPVLSSETESVDFDAGPLFGLFGSVTALTNSSYEVNWGALPYGYRVIGTGFSDTNGDGVPDTGTISSIEVYSGDSFVFGISGISRALPDIYAIPYYALLQDLLSGDDAITGSSVADVLEGFTGSDAVDGGGGDDRITDRDGGNDVIRGGAGNDVIDANGDQTAGGETQHVYGDAGNDQIIQTVSSATSAVTILLDGGAGDDSLSLTVLGFDNVNVSANGGDGDDLVSFQVGYGLNPNVAASIKLHGGAGFDEFSIFGFALDQDALSNIQLQSFERLTFANNGSYRLSCEFLAQFRQIVAPEGVSIELTSGGAVDLSTLAAPLYLRASAEGNEITAGSGNDQLLGNAANDILRGGAGDDYLHGAGGFDKLLGGAGNDTIQSADSNRYVVDGGAGTDLWYGNFYETTKPLHFTANLAAGATGIKFADGSVVRNVEKLSIEFGSGDDTYIDSLDRNGDSISLNQGNDTATIRYGVDRVYSGAFSSNNYVVGFEDTDTIHINYSDAVAALHSRNDVESFTAGELENEEIIYYNVVWEGPSQSTSTRSVVASTFDIVIITASAFGDQLTSSLGNDTLYGRGGNDVFTPGFGSDTVDGGAGSDWINFKVSRFVLTGGATIDLAVTAPQVLPDGTWGYYNIIEPLGMVRLKSIENIEGTGFADRFYGTGSANILQGMGGHDVLDGRGGNDVLHGGGGNDQLIGGSGIDTADYSGATRGVTVNLNVIGRQATGGAGKDTLSSIENLVGSSRADNLSGNGASNTLDGGTGADTMNGGHGNDIYVVDNGRDKAIEASASGGFDMVMSSVTFALGANIEKLSLIGVAAINGTGNGLANTLIGNGAANNLNGGSGADTMSGGRGNDVYIVDNKSDRVVEGVGSGTDTVKSSVSFVLSANVEKLILTGTGSVSGTGNGLANAITGNGAGNALSGADGNDTLDGGTGADVMNGGRGNDLYVVDNKSDRVIEGAGGGIDTVHSSVGFALSAFVENLILTGTGAIGGTGNGLANTITGNGNANRLDGKAGSDRMSGADGNDVYVVDNIGDIVIESRAAGGTDEVLSSVSFTLGANVEKLTLSGSAAADLTGNGAANVLKGNGAANVLNGKGGADTMAGGGGKDSYFVNDKGDSVVEAAGGGVDSVSSFIGFTLGDYVEHLSLLGTRGTAGTGNALANTISGNSGANVLKGLGGADRLVGAGAGDTLEGGGGSDALYGGRGRDTLVGGSGKDGFYFDAPLNKTFNVDHILDFNRSDDTLFLDVGVFTKIGTGTLGASAFHVGTSAADADDRIVYDQGTGKIFYDADGTGAGAAILFATVTPGIALTNADFVGF